MHWFHVNCINSYLKDGIKRIRCSNGEDTKEHEHQEPLLNHYVKTINFLLIRFCVFLLSSSTKSHIKILTQAKHLLL